MTIDQAVWQDRSVFVTGHTGFKGGWLTLWLAQMGARVTGYALPPNNESNFFDLANIEAALSEHCVADVRDLKSLTSSIINAQPEVVFHLAAQPLVRRSYKEPVETWTTNVMGVVNLLEAVRLCPSVKAVVVITTDKCYENKEWIYGYREIDRLGGHDPYAASKAAAELAVESYRKCFFQHSSCLIATARAGNVIGGGDYSEDRLIPDAARSVSAQKKLMIRNPHATRPWQHVLESLNGYLLLAQRLLAGDVECAQSFNFGPTSQDNRSVDQLLQGLKLWWPELSWSFEQSETINQVHEARFLYLDSQKANSVLNWHSIWGLDHGLRMTADWYRCVALDPTSAYIQTIKQIKEFTGLNK